jgi:ABC-type thiamine transport system substrate-binding protein
MQNKHSLSAYFALGIMLNTLQALSNLILTINPGKGFLIWKMKKIKSQSIYTVLSKMAQMALDRAGIWAQAI